MKKVYSILFVAMMAVGGLTLVNCGDLEVPDRYAVDTNISVVHKYGESPCPQLIKEVKILTTGSEGEMDEIDSVSVSAPHVAVDAFFETKGQTTKDMKKTSIATMTVQFNCQIAKSFTTELELKYFKDGKLVATEKISVDVTVKGAP